ncbi:MAG TPA: helicase-related protein [Afifellaceae bacterium]|nr:helicase-related protein [Afifellaceae bacterium]
MNIQTPRPRRWSARNVTAILGPTNTGKTHLAIERMLGHESGIIGLPLRLLAREVYGRVAARAGADQVALVTGEEKILPEQPRYWVCTVEAMPRQTDAAFVAIDEVQLAADLERGHVFTDRLLNLRGSQETLLLGAATVRGILEQLLPGIHVVTRPRMSLLTYAGPKKLTRLPERSAVVTFSADEVYAIAELIRRQRGGAAVVLGALSPRTRNKQVEIYQSGDVDFLVATDAIGMGLNLDVDHVAFAAHRKFDGYQYRQLTAAELGQVAGRAGRHLRDGTFGVTGRVDPFEDALVEALESHRFDPVRTLQWRSDQLDFSSIAALKASLDRIPDIPGLTKAPPADDQTALETLARDADIADRVRGADDVRRLWDVCRLPDYRKIAPAQHAHLVGEIAGFMLDSGVVPDDWLARQIRLAERTDGDIDTLSTRIAHIRTWTFVANQPDWLTDPAHWRGETRAVEDALSDALHERLTKRFVDRRTSVLMRRLRESTMLEAEITAAGDVLVEGQHVGAISGFRFTADPGADGAEAKALRAAAQKALVGAIADRAERLARAGESEIVLSADGYVRWQGAPVARLAAAEEPLKPRLILLADEQLAGAARDKAEGRLAAWLAGHIETVLKPLVGLAADEGLSGMARGIAFRLVENLGLIDRRDVLEEVRGLDQEARAGLRRHGVRFGAYHVYVPALLKPAPSSLLAQLWALRQPGAELPGLAEMAAVSASGRTSVEVDPAIAPELYRRFGFRIYGARAVRIDILERLADLIRPALAWRPATDGERPAGAVDGGGFTVTPAMTSLLGASGEAMGVILRGLGYRGETRPKPAEQVIPSAAGDPHPPQPPQPPAPQPSPPVPPPSEEPPVTEPSIDPPTEPPAPLPPLEQPPRDDPLPEPPPPEEPPVQEPVVPPDAAAEPAGQDAAAPAEPATIEVWRPARQGQRRPPRHRQARRQEAGLEENGAGPDRQDKKRRRKAGPPLPRPRHQAKKPERPQQAERDRPRSKPIDPDNPFAALAALKKDLEKAGK